MFQPRYTLYREKRFAVLALVMLPSHLLSQLIGTHLSPTDLVLTPNLIAVALDRVSRAAPHLCLGQLTLEKRLPVAAGIGGGSADAAAVLRLVQAANGQHIERVDWPAIAATLGADVPVCYYNHSCWMSGIGERLTPLEQPLPELYVVLANPLAPVPADKTARVFRALGAGPRQASDRNHPAISSRADLLALLRTTGNDLETAAREIVPEISTVLDVLMASPDAQIARMSGGGPTCFAVFETEATAAGAAQRIAKDHPAWWVVATMLR